MSAVKSTQYTARAAAAAGTGDFVSEGTAGGVVHQEPFDYTAASLASGSTIALLDVHKGWTATKITIQNAALGSPVTLSIGDSGSATRWVSAYAATSAAGPTTYLPGASSYTYTADDTIIITTGGGTATGAIYGTIDYMRPAGH